MPLTLGLGWRENRSGFFEDIVASMRMHGYIPQLEFNEFEHDVRGGLEKLSTSRKWECIVGIDQQQRLPSTPAIYDEISDISVRQITTGKHDRTLAEQSHFFGFLDNINSIMKDRSIPFVDIFFVFDEWWDDGSIRADMGDIDALKARLSNIGDISEMVYLVQPGSFLCDLDRPLLYTLSS